MKRLDTNSTGRRLIMEQHADGFGIRGHEKHQSLYKWFGSSEVSFPSRSKQFGWTGDMSQVVVCHAY